MITVRTVDRLVGLLVVGIVLVGSYSWWRAIRRTRSMGMMGSMPGMDPVWYLFGTLIAVSVVLGAYAVGRERLAERLPTAAPADEEAVDRTESGGRSSEVTSGRSDRDPSNGGAPRRRASALAFLPDDERRIVEPILESPGLTQVELRGRSGFSKAKVSQTVSELENRGLIYREKQGRTYRVYPGELLKENADRGEGG